MSDNEITIMLVGDIAPIKRVGEYRYIDYTISNEVKAKFNNADIVIGNLESTITESDEYDISKPVVYKIPVKEHIHRAFKGYEKGRYGACGST